MTLGHIRVIAEHVIEMASAYRVTNQTSIVNLAEGYLRMEKALEKCRDQRGTCDIDHSCIYKRYDAELEATLNGEEKGQSDG